MLRTYITRKKCLPKYTKILHLFFSKINIFCERTDKLKKKSISQDKLPVLSLNDRLRFKGSITSQFGLMTEFIKFSRGKNIDLP